MPLEMNGSDVLLTKDAGLVSHRFVIEEDVLGQGSRLSASDRRRNERLERRRELVPTGNAILGIDLADTKQHAVLADHDSRVVKRFRVTAKAWQLGGLLDRAVVLAREAGFGSVTVVCEPTGHRWQIVQQEAADRGLPMVCIQPLVMRRAREQEDYTSEKTDPKDAVLIARLAAKLHCYEPELLDETWAELRHAGARRDQLIVAGTAQAQQVRDLLECGWPAALAAAPTRPFRSATWLAALHVVVSRCDGRPERAAKWGIERFTAAVRRDLPRFGGTNLWSSTVEKMFAALSDPTGVRTRRAGALNRVRWLLADHIATGRRLAEAEGHMLGLLDTLGLTELMGSIPGVSPLGAAAILAQTGDPTRFSHARALVKHAGLAPRARASGEYTGTSRVTGRGRPALRLAAWRAVFGALHHNPVLQQRYKHLTERPTNPLSDGQARAALAATLLRWIYAIATRGVPFDPDTATAQAARAVAHAA